jgi:hypothetical protein
MTGGDRSTYSDNRDRLANTLAEARQLRRSLQEWTNANNAPGSRIDYPDLGGEFTRQADDLYRDVVDVLRELQAAGIPVQDADELRRLAQAIRAAEFDGNEEILARESRLALTLVEQLELALAGLGKAPDTNIRAPQANEIPDEHRQVIADYYRRLGESDR